MIQATRPTTTQTRVAFDTALVRYDIAAKGWTSRDVAVRAGLCLDTVSRFLLGKRRSPKTARAIARALRRPVSRYVLGVEPRRAR